MTEMLLIIALAVGFVVYKILSHEDFVDQFISNDPAPSSWDEMDHRTKS